MATSKDFHAYIMEQLYPVGDVTSRSMMGEYCLYYRGKLFGMICDNTLLIKQTPSALRLLCDCDTALPYEGAKQELLVVEDAENLSLMTELLEAMYEELPFPKKKK